MSEYIDRKKAIKAACEALELFPSEEQELETALKNVPTENVEPVKHSKWVGYTTGAFHGMDDLGDPIYRDVTVYHCDNCSRRTVVKENYCPRCGARMNLE